MTESRDIRLKRLRMRGWHRGTKEMDLILGPFCDSDLVELSDADLDDFEALLEENDQDLYQWVSGQLPPPEPHRRMIATLRARHGIG